MGDISFSALIHSLMNFYIGTTQAGDNKFVSLMLVCAHHMAKAGTQGLQEIHEHEAFGGGSG